MNKIFEFDLYARARREGWKPLSKRSRVWKWTLRGLGWIAVPFVGAVVGLIFLVAIPLIFFLPLAIPVGIANKNLADIDFSAALSPETALGLQSAIVAVIATATSVSGYRLFVKEESLAVLPFYPVGDRELQRGQKRPWMLWLTHYVLSWIGVTALLTWRIGLNGWQVAGLLALGTMQASHMAALIVAIAPWAPSRRRWGDKLGSMLICSVFLYSFSLAFFPALAPPRFVLHVLYASPFGWIHGAMNYAVIEGHPAGWLFLLPAALLWLYSFGLWKRGFAIREFRIESTGAIAPLFEYGFQNVKERPKAPAKRQSALRLEESPALAAPDWSGGWCVERWIGKRLSSREKTLLEQSFGGQPRWTLAFLIEAAAIVLFASVGVYLQTVSIYVPAMGGGNDYRETVFGAFTLPLFSILILTEVFTTARRPNGFRALSPLYPCGMRETLKAHRKSFLWRLALLMPLVVILATVENWRRENVWRHLLLVLGVIATAIFAYAPLAARSQFYCVSTTQRLSWRWLEPVAVSLLLFALGFSIMLSSGWQETLSLAAALLVCSRYACWRMDNRFAKGELDLRALAMPVRSQAKAIS